MFKYRISPSLLDKFQRYLNADADFESDFNYSEETGYLMSFEDMVATREKELLDAINKVPEQPSLAASRGTAFNEAVDSMVMHKYRGVHSKEEDGKIIPILDLVGDTINADANGFSFVFDRKLVEDVADIVAEGTMQMHIQAGISTERGDVLLHGFPDYILPTQITDLKTTDSYIFGKYEHYWQRYAYPYILQKLGLMERVDAFEFLVVEMKTDKKTGITSGTIYKETYTDVSFEKCQAELRWILNGLLIFIEDHRNQITNERIFNK